MRSFSIRASQLQISSVMIVCHCSLLVRQTFLSIVFLLDKTLDDVFYFSPFSSSSSSSFQRHFFFSFSSMLIFSFSRYSICTSNNQEMRVRRVFVILCACSAGKERCFEIDFQVNFKEVCSPVSHVGLEVFQMYLFDCCCWCCWFFSSLLNSCKYSFDNKNFPRKTHNEKRSAACFDFISRSQTK